MHRTLAGWAAVAVVVSAPAVSAQDRDADWIRKPSARDLMGVYPVEALKKGIGGRATIVCIATVQGTLRACRVEAQSPEGVGFGGAALALAPQFALRPAMKGGAPVESAVRIPIDFPKPDRALDSFITPGTDGPRFKGNLVYSRMPYLTAPTYADVLAAYPAKARAAHKGGNASVNCRIGDEGKLGSCAIIREEPLDMGFGAAARSLGPKFTVPAKDGQGRETKGAHTVVLVTFAAETLDGGGGVVGQPRWLALPKASDLAQVLPAEARKAGALQARVVIRCTVSATGSLESCTPVSQEPDGLGYGAAAVSISRFFRLATWTEEGLPTVGGTVRVPVRFDFAPKTAAPAAAAPSGQD